MATDTRSAIRLRDVPKVSHREAMVLAEAQNRSLLIQLRSLAPEDWDRPSDCAGWSVKDVAAHLLGWAEAMTSPGEAVRQLRGAYPRRKGAGGVTNAQNEVQVETRRDMSPDELISSLERSLPRFVKVRRVAGVVGKPLPLYNVLLGWTNVGFVADAIYTRDVFMHRIDIAHGLGRELDVDGSDERIVLDCLREWGTASKANARLELTGPAGGTFVAGDGSAAIIRGSAIDLCRLFAGREEPDAFEIEGSRADAERWLSVPVRF